MTRARRRELRGGAPRWWHSGTLDCDVCLPREPTNRAAACVNLSTDLGGGAGDDPVNRSDPSGFDPACTDSGGGNCVVEGIPLSWNEYSSVTDAVLHHNGGVTPMLLQGIFAITWQETYGSGSQNDPQRAIDDLTTWGLPNTAPEVDCSAVPSPDPVSGFHCFEYAVLGVYAVNHNHGGLPTSGALEELKQAQVYPVEYLYLLEEQHWPESLLATADLAHVLGEVSDYFPELFEIGAALTAYGAPASCGQSPPSGAAL
jgi:hypothetical protein